MGYLKEKFNNLDKETQESIKDAHKAAEVILEAINTLTKHKIDCTTITGLIGINEAILGCNSALESLEYVMQLLWGFEQDYNYHTWWLKAKDCECPKLDNMDPMYYGAGKIITGSCPVHGALITEFHRARVEKYLQDFKRIRIVLEIDSTNSDDTYTYGGFIKEYEKENIAPQGLLVYYINKDKADDCILCTNPNDSTVYTLVSFVELPVTHNSNPVVKCMIHDV